MFKMIATILQTQVSRPNIYSKIILKRSCAALSPDLAAISESNFNINEVMEPKNGKFLERQIPNIVAKLEIT